MQQVIVDAEKSLAIAERQQPTPNKSLTTILTTLIELNAATRDFHQAELFVERLLQNEGKPAGNRDVGLQLAAMLAEQGGALEDIQPPKTLRATPLLQKALEIRGKILGPNDVLIAQSLDDLATNFVMQRKFADAEPLYDRALAISEKDMSVNKRYFVIILTNKGLMHFKQHRYSDAQSAYQRAFELAQQQPKLDESLSAIILDKTARLYNETGRQNEARGLQERADALRAMSRD